MDKILKKDIYNCYNHRKSRIRYHVILTTKYRKKCLEPIKSTVLDAFKYIEETSHIKIHVINIDKDHVHMIISFPHEYSISQTINRLKQGSAHYIYGKEKEYMKKFYWKEKEILWSHSYFVSTIGYVSDSKVINYIEHQG